MAYLLDANTFIQAKNQYYSFSLCPGFWDWIDFAASEGITYSIENVLDELKEGRDELKDWAVERRSSLFLPVDDQDTVLNISIITKWVQENDFSEAEKRKFLAKADPVLIAYAIAHDFIVVTQEAHVPRESKKVKIPTVCKHFGVQYVDTFRMLDEGECRFVLDKNDQ